MRSCGHIWSGGFLRLTLFRRWRARGGSLLSPATPTSPAPLLRHLSALTVESSVGSSTLLSFTAATGASACPGADVAMPCDAPPSAPPSPNANSTHGPSVWGGSGAAERTRAGTGTVKGVSAAGGGSAAEGGPGSEAARGGVRAATGGGASSQGVSTRCPESCTLSAGGCTDSHTQKTRKPNFNNMHIASES